jgi:hypothetical protein
LLLVLPVWLAVLQAPLQLLVASWVVQLVGQIHSPE